jgi:hypothetical protein
MRRVSQAELRAFLLDRLGLRGAFWSATDSPVAAVDLGMIQIDSIRVTGLRNHDLAWVARSEAAPAALAEAIYGQGRFRETHYPLFAVRRDWLPLLSAGFTDFPQRHRAERRRLRPLMNKLTQHMHENGPVTVGQFASKRIAGGFNTVKATTKALEYLFYDRVVQISGRTPNFHRVFDLTERAAPELLPWSPPDAAAYERFLIESALGVLKAATADQIADRVALHYGQWRGESIRRWRALVARRLLEVADSVVVADLPDQPVYWYRREDEAGWARAQAPVDDVVRVVPPLDNLLFSRKRFSQLFGFDYKFEAYTPAAQRRFYFAMPLVYDHDVVGLIDIRLERGNGRPEWQIVGLDMRKPVSPEALRAGLHRVARIAGAEKVAVVMRTTRDLRRTLTGSVSRSV